MKPRVFPYAIILMSLLVLQWMFATGNAIPNWQGTKQFRQDLSVLDQPPSPAQLQGGILGDKQWLFRWLALKVQNAGDTFGRVTALKAYDYGLLKNWWEKLDILDHQSHYIPSMVSYYFGATQEHDSQIPHVVDYLESHADKDPGKKWWWYTQAIYHARHKLGDTDRALTIAKKLNTISQEASVPIWARQMEAFVQESRGEYKEACDIILNILDDYEGLSQTEINFMIHFINERIQVMEENALKAYTDIDPRCQALYSAN